MSTGDALIAAQLRDTGHRVTSQRLVLHRAVREAGRHVTAEEVLEAVRERLPGVALPTVYAILELFERLGLVRRIRTPSGPAVFDPVLDGHHHLVCRGCGAVHDLPPTVETASAVADAAALGFDESRAEVVLTGLCPGCAAPA
jgi:Fur family ferric uptake transcriptional regulator